MTAGAIAMGAITGNVLPTDGIADTTSRIAEIRPVPESVHRQAMESPKNLARWNMGARIYGTDWGSNPQPMEWGDRPNDPIVNLMEDDMMATTSLPPGETDIVIDLGRFYRLDTVRFFNIGMRGSFEAQGSNTLHPPGSRRWTNLAPQASVAADGIIGISFPLTETRYLRLRFDSATTGGKLSGLFVAGDARVADAAPVLPPAERLYEPTDTAMVGFNFASLPAGARVTHVSSGNPEDAAKIIDDDPLTEFRFLLEDGDSIFIVEYADTFRFNSTTLVMDAGRGTMEVYGLRDLPTYLEPGDETEHVYLPHDFFDTHAPSARRELDQPARHLQLDMNGVEARYMLVRFQGINNPTPSFGVSNISGIGSIPRMYAQYVVSEVFEFAEPDSQFLETEEQQESAPRLPVASP